MYSDLNPYVLSLGRDIPVGTSPWVTGTNLVDPGSTYYNMSPGDLNRDAWNNNYVGFRKTLQVGGGGKVYFLKVAPALADLTVVSPTIGAVSGISIPQNAILLKSVANPLLNKDCVYSVAITCPSGFNVLTYSVATPAQGDGNCKTPDGATTITNGLVVTTGIKCSCPAGYGFTNYTYGPPEVVAFCTQCLAGTYSSGGTNMCQTCPVGTNSLLGASASGCDIFISINITGTVGGTLPNSPPPGCTVTSGIYKWTVPLTRIYTFLLKGGGGAGSGRSAAGGAGGSVKTTITLNANQTVYLIVGGGATNGCGGGLSAVFITSIGVSSGTWTIVGGGGGGWIYATTPYNGLDGGNGEYLNGAGGAGTGSDVRDNATNTNCTGGDYGGGGGCGALVSTATFLGGKTGGGFGGGGGLGGSGGGGYTGGNKFSYPNNAGGGSGKTSAGWTTTTYMTNASNGGLAGASGGAGSITIT